MIARTACEGKRDDGAETPAPKRNDPAAVIRGGAVEQGADRAAPREVQGRLPEKVTGVPRTAPTGTNWTSTPWPDVSPEAP